MKSYSVKSNAKRFARGIAAKAPELFEVMEPVADASGEWVPKLKLLAVDNSGTPVLPDSATVRLAMETCIFEAPVAAVEDNAAVFSAEPPEPAEAVTADVAKAEAPGLSIRPYQQAVIDRIKENPEELAAPISLPMAPARVGKAVTLAELAATLPPLVVSTPEEIEARRALRRARIEAEKADPKPKAEKISRKQNILDLVARANGATAEELEAATGWQRHTLRGYIAGTLRKEVAPKFGIDCVRKKGEPTRYVMTAKGGDA